MPHCPVTPHSPAAVLSLTPRHPVTLARPHSHVGWRPRLALCLHNPRPCREAIHIRNQMFEYMQAVSGLPIRCSTATLAITGVFEGLRPCAPKWARAGNAGDDAFGMLAIHAKPDLRGAPTHLHSKTASSNKPRRPSAKGLPSVPSMARVGKPVAKVAGTGTSTCYGPQT